MRQRDGLPRERDADERQPIAAVAVEPRIRRGTSADAGCHNLKTKDRCLTPIEVFGFQIQAVRRTISRPARRQVVFMRRLSIEVRKLGRIARAFGSLRRTGRPDSV
jgi:hypothetical protein